VDHIFEVYFEEWYQFVYLVLNNPMAYGKAISKERNLKEVKLWHKTLFLKSHSSFIAHYETTIGDT